MSKLGLPQVDLPLAVEPPIRQGVFASLAQPIYRQYWVGLLISNIGAQMQALTVGWLVLRLSGSALAVGAVGFAGAIPRLILMPIGGVLADRIERRRMQWITQFAQMAGAALLTLIVASEIASVWMVGALVFLDGVAYSLWAPSNGATIVDLVDRAQMRNAVSMAQTQFNLSRMIGPTIAGFLLTRFDESLCFALNAASFVPLLFVIGRLPAKKALPTRSRGAVVDMRAGLRYARRHKSIPSLLWITGAIAFFGSPLITMTPVFARMKFEVGSSGLGAMVAAIGIGAVTAALLSAWQGNVTDKGWRLQGGTAALALALGGFSQSSSYWVSLAFLALFGAGLIYSMGLSVTILQLHAPNRMRGRLSSLHAVASLGLSALGNLAAGAIAQWSTPSLVPLAGSVGIIATLVAVKLVRPLSREG